MLAICGKVYTVIWGSVLRFSDAGTAASEQILEESGLAMMICLIIQYITVIGPCICLCIIIPFLCLWGALRDK